MPLDLNRIQMNTSLSDKDAFRYYRQTQPVVNPSITPAASRGWSFRRTLKTRPVLVVVSCLLGGLSVGYTLIQLRDSGDHGEAVYNTIDKIRADFAKYEASLRSK